MDWQNLVLWKRLNTETDRKVNFGSVSFFQELLELPQKLKCWGISEYYWSISLKFTFDLFPVFLDRFSHILGSFPGFGKSYKFSVYWLVSFFSIRFRKFLVRFRVSEKCYKFLFCCSVSFFTIRFRIFLVNIFDFPNISG